MRRGSLASARVTSGAVYGGGHQPEDLVGEAGHTRPAEQRGQVSWGERWFPGAGGLLVNELQHGGRAQVKLIEQEVVRVNGATFASGLARRDITADHVVLALRNLAAVLPEILIELPRSGPGVAVLGQGLTRRRSCAGESGLGYWPPPFIHAWTEPSGLTLR